MSKQLAGKISSRLRIQREEDIKRCAEARFAEYEKQLEKTSLDNLLIENGQALRERILWHERTLKNRRSRRLAKWFGPCAIEMSIRMEPPLIEIFAKKREIDKEIEDGEEKNNLLKRVSHDTWYVIATPLLMLEPPEVIDGNLIEFGWRFSLREGPRISQDGEVMDNPSYSYDASPISIFRVVRAVNSRDEEEELWYKLLLPGDMYTQKTIELQRFTDGEIEDGLVIDNQDINLHVLGLFQGALREL